MYTINFHYEVKYDAKIDAKSRFKTVPNYVIVFIMCIYELNGDPAPNVLQKQFRSIVRLSSSRL